MIPTASDNRQSSVPARRAPPWLAWTWLYLGCFVVVAASLVAWLQPGSLPRADRTSVDEGFWHRVLAPVESNSFQKLLVVRPDLSKLYLTADGKRAWVAAGSKILHTKDAGRTWGSTKSLLDDSSGSIRALVFPGAGQRGFAVTDAGTLLVSEDSGASWTRRVRAEGDPYHWEFIAFSEDGKFGMAMSNEAGVFISSDLGTSWQRKQLPSAEPFRIQSVHVAPRGQVALLVGLKQVFRTDDGAASWSMQAQALQAMHVGPSGQRIWAAASDGIYHSANGGRTWSLQSGSPDRMVDLTFNGDELRGWAVGLDGRIARTIDGGRTWQAIDTGTVQALSRVRFGRDGDAGMAVGAAGTMLVSSDGGRDWRSATWPAIEQLAVERSDDLSHIWVARKDGIRMTQDGGRSWTLNRSVQVRNIRSMMFHADARRGWAVTDKAMLATRDGGMNWSVQVPITTSSWPASIVFLADGLRGWAVVGERVLNTFVGAGKWTDTPELSGKGIRKVLFASDGRGGWALGEVLWTIDRGRSWAPVAASATLGDIAFGDDGMHGYAIDTTRMYTTGDGGKTWLPKACPGPCQPRSVAASGDGRRAWVGNIDGSIAHTSDGGLTWARTDSGITDRLVAIRFSHDGNQGLAIGSLGEMARSDDGGRSWHPADRYARAPAPWYWVTIAMAAFLIWLAWHLRPRRLARPSIADIGASDAAIGRASEDRLGFGGLARGISRFLRNRATGAPLTLAINGDWGSGKSSLMQLVCADLLQFHHYPVWFNAWHHQKEEHLFAALLGAVRKQAVPPVLSLPGPVFRLHLLWLRSRKHFLIMMLVVFIATALLAVTVPSIARFDLTRVVPTIETFAAFWQPLLGVFTTLVAAWAAVKIAVKPFHVNPALLLTTLRDSMSVKTAAAQNDFRDQFARQFSELTQALPQRLVIVIDDLDRCRPAAVLDVMEAVNYLTSAGECMVIFGMARERVLASLGLAFKDIAEELALMDTASAAGEGDADPSVVRRRNFAADYLQKLVNIEITVPSTRDRPLHALFGTPDPAPRRTLLGAIASLKKLWPLGAAGIAVVAGMWLATWIPVAAVDGLATAQKAAPALAAASASSGASAQPLPAPPAATPIVEAPPVAAQTVHPGQRASPFAVLGWLALAAMPPVATAALVVMRLLRSSINETRDSESFRRALEIWTPLVVARHATPRSVKRFGNRVRYLAMLQQGEQDDDTRSGLLKRRIAELRGKPLPPPVRTRVDVLAEHQLTALGAIHDLYGAQWERYLAALNPSPEAEARDPALPILRGAIDAHQKAFESDWPPSAKEVAVFKRLLSGVRLAGDPEVLGSARRSRRAGAGASAQQAQR